MRDVKTIQINLPHEDVQRLATLAASAGESPSATLVRIISAAWQQRHAAIGDPKDVRA